MAGVDHQRAIAVQVSQRDNVATLASPVGARGRVAVHMMSGSTAPRADVVALQAIPAGHKIALDDIAADAEVLKYGLAIARARAAISRGEHVHVHNAVSTISPSGPSAPATAAARIGAEQLRSAVLGALGGAGLPEAAAQSFADHMVEAHLRGVETHGLRRIMPYLARIRAGGVDAGAEPHIAAKGALVHVDGRNAVGHHVASVAADAVAAASREHGVAAALVRNSNHFGFAGYYATRIAAHGMAAMVTSNGQVLVGPHGARQPLFSNDPVAIAAPLDDGTFLELDMATSVSSRAKIVAAAECGEAIPPGWALDSHGDPTIDAAAALEGVLLPFGGDKGFAFISAIEMLTGILSGGAYADTVSSKEADPCLPEGTAHFLLAIDIESALGREAFQDRLRDMVARIADLKMREGAPAPRHPGARRWSLRRERLADGIPLQSGDLEILRRLEEEYGAGVSAT
jgi:LDH2 family malate/lactate/ureidoglycolate dehydrogenase